jgi:hypothetical protein
MQGVVTASSSRRRRFRMRRSSQWTNVLLLLVLIACPFLLFQGAQACTPNCGNQNNKEPTRPVIGIDLGTTYSVVGVMKNGKVEIVSRFNLNPRTPADILRYRTIEDTEPHRRTSHFPTKND